MEKKNNGLVIFLTDFGHSHYAGMLHGVVLKYNPNVTTLDLCHNITPFAVVEASYILSVSYRYFPSGAIFVVVIDPGVGTKRDILITRYKEYTFVAPDNGVLSPFFAEGKTFKLTDLQGFKNISSTFHGRDIFAPLAGVLSRGESPENLGIPEENPIKIEWWEPQKIDNQTYQGIILHTDRFGNAITNIPCSYLRNIREIRIKGVVIRDSFISFGYAPYNTPFMYCGSSNFIEIALRENNFAKKYNITTLTPLICVLK